MHLTIRDGWFSAATAVHIGAGEDHLIFERCTFHGGEIEVEPGVDTPIFIACLFQGTAFPAQRLNPKIAANCQWEPPTTEEAMPRFGARPGRRPPAGLSRTNPDRGSISPYCG